MNPRATGNDEAGPTPEAPALCNVKYDNAITEKFVDIHRHCAPESPSHMSRPRHCTFLPLRHGGPSRWDVLDKPHSVYWLSVADPIFAGDSDTAGYHSSRELPSATSGSIAHLPNQVNGERVSEESVSSGRQEERTVASVTRAGESGSCNVEPLGGQLLLTTPCARVRGCRRVEAGSMGSS